VPDAAGFEAFYRDNLARIVRACALVTLDVALAEDVAAEAFVRLWSRWGQIRGPDHAGGFVFKTAMRLCGREVRRRGRVPAAARGEVDEVQQALDRHEVIRSLAGLPLRQRQAVVLRDWAGFETGEVARMLGMKESTVRVHLARGREHLRRSLRVESENER
jgi:RNA polymerase sigma factor (sigma-70 family)